MRKLAVLSAVFIFLGVSNINAQTVYPNMSEPRPLIELGIPWAQDSFFFANYSPNTIVVYVNRREVATVPPFTYQRMVFYVASRTRVEAYTNVVTDKGTRRVKMRGQAVVIQKGEGTLDSGWIFFR